MYESHDQIIKELVKAYFDHLPKRLSETKDPNERLQLAEQQQKVGHLLARGYGVSLSASRAAAAPTADGTPTVTPPLRRRIAFASAPVESLSQTQDTIVVPTVKVRARGELARAIHTLRLEYHLKIPEQLACTVEESDRKALVSRSMNIRNILKRGYSVPVCTREEVLEMDRYRRKK